MLSGVTDVVDGWVARTYHMVSNFGKAIDPVADKLTQIAVLLCLMPMKCWWVVGILVLKEVSIGIMTLLTLHHTGMVYGAGWYGKLCTAVSGIQQRCRRLLRDVRRSGLCCYCIYDHVCFRTGADQSGRSCAYRPHELSGAVLRR